MKPEEKMAIAQKSKDLHHLNEQVQDKSVLPILKLEDVEVAPPPCDLVLAVAKGVPFQLCALPTNGVTYFRAIIHTGGVPEKNKKYVALFADVLTEMGVEGMDYKELNHEVTYTSFFSLSFPHSLSLSVCHRYPFYH
jgi:Zn-dependent M16 (insulinase) family peptidase